MHFYAHICVKQSLSLLEGSVRRSSRLNKLEGLCPVMIDKEPTKKRKISVININEKTRQADPVLQDWGINCGIAPGELSNEGLMQEPSIQESDDVPDENVPI
jgi:hypothetical protein